VTTSIPGLGKRREAREEALALLYESSVSGVDVAGIVAGRVLPPEEYAIEIASGIDRDRPAIDELIAANIKGWRIERMALVDRMIASIATWELVNRGDVPTGVVLSEAVELATQYAGEESPRFLNGLLRAIANEVRGA